MLLGGYAYFLSSSVPTALTHFSKEAEASEKILMKNKKLIYAPHKKKSKRLMTTHDSLIC